MKVYLFLFRDDIRGQKVRFVSLIVLEALSN